MRPTKREQLLATAERLFYEEGFHATGVDRVIAEAGVARMTLYKHFPSKEALVEATLIRRQGRYRDDLIQAVNGARPGAAVNGLIECHGRWLRTEARAGCMVIKAIAEFERHASGIATVGRALKRELTGVIRAALERDGAPAGAAEAERILLLLEGANALVPVLGPERVMQRLWEMHAATRPAHGSPA